MDDNITSPVVLSEEVNYENSLRPTTFDDFIGQKQVKDNMNVFIQSSKMRKDILDHILLYGPPGIGKTTLAYIIGHQLGVNIKSSSGPVIEKAGDLAGILTNLEEGDILFIDEIHRIPRVVEEYLYSAMEDFNIDIMLGEGPKAKSVKIPLKRFTLIGATTRIGLLTSPLRNRFGIIHRLDYYNVDELAQIIKRSSGILNIKINDEGSMEIANRSRGTPRISNRLLKRVRDFAIVQGETIINKQIAAFALDKMLVDSRGLDEMDKRILETIIYKFNGGPVGLKSLAIAVGEEPETIEEVYESYLVREGFIQKTSQGRTITKITYQHLKIKTQEGLFSGA
ncbi:MAG: Holliday junction branch migration DNA helicase RuvB [Candidatus Omnitrophica bacterium]|jgi:Holliday junction DNA helicase RuvB|nr:Holliday junction branch migration DNA helicase RuvB [Candidatus Omnitrophota bacterium]